MIHKLYPWNVATSVVKAYLHRTKKDITELAKIGTDVRLCKGAYNEPEGIALQNMDVIHQVYKDYAGVLLEEAPYPRRATHDDELVSWLKEYAREQDISPSRFEFQMLYGLRQETIEEYLPSKVIIHVFTFLMVRYVFFISSAD